MRHLLLALALIAPLAMAGPAAAQDDIDKINGTAQVEAGQRAGDINTVNGAVRIGAGAVVSEASTVNGSITLGSKAQASSLGAVNGAVTAEPDSVVSGNVETINGRISLAGNAQVHGRVSNVNGTIVLQAARVDGGIETVSGDIDVGADSRVDGGIVVDKPGGWFHFNSRTPTVVIGPRAVVNGTLEFRQEVKLQVSESAQIGPVKGAKVERFSGEKP